MSLPPVTFDSQSAYTPASAGVPTTSESAPHWNLGTLIAFRACFVYFTLYIVLTQMFGALLPIPGFNFPNLDTIRPFRNVILWVGAHVVGISHPISSATTGSGDKTFDWVELVAFLIAAVVVTAAWTARDRVGNRDARMYKWVRLFFRLALGTSILGYGLIKLFPMQMSFFVSRLVEPYGNFSPMGVLWSSIGSSYSYEMFTGACETTAALLLLFPRTALLGSVVALADMFEVFMLNMTYDVPVKQFSLHLVLLSIFLLAPNIQRLLGLFVGGKTVKLAQEPDLGSTPRAHRGWRMAQTVFGVWTVSLGVYGMTKSWKTFGGGAPKSPFYGIWTVDQMSVNGQLRAPLLTDSTRWRYLIFDRPTNVLFQRLNDTRRGFGLSVDTVAKTMALSAGGKDSTKYPLAYQRTDIDHMTIDGALLGDTLHLELTRRAVESFQIRRGFHWISEVPYNR